MKSNGRETTVDEFVLLAKSLPSGSEEYFRALGDAFEKIRPRVIRFLCSRGATLDEAEEATQEAALRVVEKFAQLRVPTMFTTWTSSIALNIQCVVKRRGKLFVSLSKCRGSKFPDLTGTTIPVDRADPRDFEQMAMARCLVERALANVKPAERRLLEMYDIEGHGTVTVGAELGISRTAVRIRVMRARRNAKTQVEKRQK
jgi:RNA polymerase sigma factor (sigma-70 family)